MILDAGPKRTPVIPLWHVMFPSGALEEESAYRDHYLEDDMRQIIAIMLASVGFLFAFSVIDIPVLASSAEFQFGFLLRTGLMILGAFLIWVVRTYRSATVLDWSPTIFATCVAIAVVTFHATSDVSGIRIVTVMTVFIFAAHIAFPSYGVWTLVPALIMIFGEGFVIFSSANEEIITNRAVMVVAAVFATLMSVTASAHHHRARYQSFQAMRKVKMLSGLLPICASCKKIRDDQGYYQQIEL